MPDDVDEAGVSNKPMRRAFSGSDAFGKGTVSVRSPKAWAHAIAHLLT